MAEGESIDQAVRGVTTLSTASLKLVLRNLDAELAEVLRSDLGIDPRHKRASSSFKARYTTRWSPEFKQLLATAFVVEAQRLALRGDAEPDLLALAALADDLVEEGHLDRSERVLPLDPIEARARWESAIALQLRAIEAERAIGAAIERGEVPESADFEAVTEFVEALDQVRSMLRDHGIEEDGLTLSALEELLPPSPLSADQIYLEAAAVQIRAVDDAVADEVEALVGAGAAADDDDLLRSCLLDLHALATLTELVERSDTQGQASWMGDQLTSLSPAWRPLAMMVVAGQLRVPPAPQGDAEEQEERTDLAEPAAYESPIPDEGPTGPAGAVEPVAGSPEQQATLQGSIEDAPATNGPPTHASAPTVTPPPERERPLPSASDGVTDEPPAQSGDAIAQPDRAEALQAESEQEDEQGSSAGPRTSDPLAEEVRATEPPIAESSHPPPDPNQGTDDTVAAIAAIADELVVPSAKPGPVARVRLLDEALAAGDLAVASLAEGAEQPTSLGLVLSAAAIAAGPASEDDDAARTAVSRLALLPIDQMLDSAGKRVLALATLIRLALVAPYSGAGELLHAWEPHITLSPQLQSFLDVALRAIDRHCDIGRVQASATSRPDARSSVVSEARSFLDQAPNRTITYQLATSVWRQWLRSDGWVHRLLDPVVADDDSRRDDLARALEDLPPIDRRIDDTTSAVRRGPRQKEIVADARHTLESRAQEVEGLAVAWLDALRTPRRQDDEASLVRDVLAAWEVVEPHIEEQVRAMTTGEATDLDGGLAVAARSIIERTLAPTDQPDQSRSLDPISLRLLRAGIVPDGSEPDRVLTAAEAEALLTDLSAPDINRAIDSLCEAHRFDLAQELVRAVHEDPQPALDEIEQRLEAERDRLSDQAETVRADLESARSLGVVSEEQMADLSEMLDLAQPGATDDLATTASDLRDISDEIDRWSSQKLSELKDDVDHSGLTEDVKAGVLALIDTGDLAVARQALTLAEHGQSFAELTLPPLDAGDILSTSTSASQETPIDAKLRRSILDGAHLLGVEWDTLPTSRREEMGQAIVAWQELGDGQTPTMPRVRDVLRLVGLDVTNIFESSSRGKGRGPIASVEVAGSHNDRAMVPQFGSRSGGRYSVLLCRGNPSEAELKRAIAEQERPVIALWFDTLTMGHRRQIGQVCRASVGKPAVVVDDALVLDALMQARPSFERTMHLTLPFSGVNPYEPYGTGRVAEEVFYGRSTERARLVDPFGPSFVWGGRQLGKSALLRATQREIDRSGPSATTILLDLAGYEWGKGMMPSIELWSMIDEALTQADIPVGSAGSPPRSENMKTTGNRWAQRIEARITNWLNEDGSRRLVLLIDEVDRFLEADADLDLPVVSSLRRIRDISNRRFKPILAGLHQTQRFAQSTNGPFGHFESLPIGPLEPTDARNLVQRPLHALGFDPTPAAVNRILAQTLFNPGLIQLLCHALVDAIHRGSISRVLPSVIDVRRVDSVSRSSGIEAELRNRFQLTLDLDHRYRVIIDILARNWDQRYPGADRGLDDDELEQLARGAWPTGFSKTSLVDFRSLVEELLRLRIIRKRIDGPAVSYVIAGAEVRILLGSARDVEARLARTDELREPWRHSGDDLRRLIDAAAPAASPFTWSQEQRLLGGTRPTAVVIGSPIAGIDEAVAALKTGVRDDKTTMIVNDATQFDALLANPPGEDVGAIVVDLRGGEPALRRVVDAAKHASPDRPPIVTVARSTDEAVQATVDLLADPQVDVVVLEPWSEHGIHHLLVNQLGRSEALEARDVLRVTGGWHDLVIAVAQQLIHGNDGATALETARNRLDEQAQDLLGRACLTDGFLAETFAIFAEYQDPVDRAEFELLLDHPHLDSGALMDLLLSLGLLRLDDGGTRAIPENVLSATWRRANAADVATEA